MNRLIVIALFCGRIALGGGVDKFAGADIARPDFFPILPWDPYHSWVKPPLEHNRENGLQSIADCHFNCAGFVLPRDLAECKKLRLGAIVLPVDPAFTNFPWLEQWRHLSDAEIDRRVKNTVRAAGSSAAIKGYFIMDEPGAGDFASLGKAVAAVKKYAPGKLAYINLFPDYATLGARDISQLETGSYTEYLERFVNEVHPQMISYDNYKVEFSSDLANRAEAAGYYLNLMAVRQVALKYHLPYLNIVSANQIKPDTTIPSPANLLFQTYTTLAAGYRGVTWYTYYSQGYAYAPIDLAGKKTQTWPYLQEVNRQVATLAPILSRLESTGVFFTAPAPAAGLPALPGKIIASANASVPLMIGEFDHYAMVVNLSLEKSALFKLDTVRPDDPIQIVSTVDRSLSTFDRKNGLWLTAGQGALLKFGPPM